VPGDLGVDCDNYKWRQNQTHVEVFVCLPETARPNQVQRTLLMQFHQQIPC
jgi:hypothetical protein